MTSCIEGIQKRTADIDQWKISCALHCLKVFEQMISHIIANLILVSFFILLAHIEVVIFRLVIRLVIFALFTIPLIGVLPNDILGLIFLSGTLTFASMDLPKENVVLAVLQVPCWIWGMISCVVKAWWTFTCAGWRAVNQGERRKRNGEVELLDVLMGAQAGLKEAGPEQARDVLQACLREVQAPRWDQ